MSDFVLNDALYMPRKSFEFGVKNVDSEVVRDLIAELAGFDARVPHTQSRSETDLFWIREHACYLAYCRNRGIAYREYLPGREYTYQLVAQLVHRLMGRHNFRMLEGGCGSAVASSLLAARNARVIALDTSGEALRFARVLSDEWGASLDLVMGDLAQLPFPDGSMDICYSLGVLEHIDWHLQLLYTLELSRVSGTWIVLLIPNRQSPIYMTMEAKEFADMPVDLVYPEERHLYGADLGRLAVAASLQIVEEGAIHIVPPRIIPEKFLDDFGRAFFERIQRSATDFWTGKPLETWLRVEQEVTPDERVRYGWFTYMVLRKP